MARYQMLVVLWAVSSISNNLLVLSISCGLNLPDSGQLDSSSRMVVWIGKQMVLADLHVER